MRNLKLSMTLFSSLLAFALAPLIGAVGASAGELKQVSSESPAAKSADAVGEEDVDIIIRGLPTKGRVVLPPTETEFKFKLKDTGTIMGFRWSDLEEYERKRVQKLY